MIRQSAPLSINSTAGHQFIAHATATCEGLRVIVAEEYENDDNGLSDFALMQARMLSAEVFERHFTWSEFAECQSLSSAGARVLSENGINQWV